MSFAVAAGPRGVFLFCGFMENRFKGMLNDESWCFSVFFFFIFFIFFSFFHIFSSFFIFLKISRICTQKLLPKSRFLNLSVVVMIRRCETHVV